MTEVRDVSEILEKIDQPTADGLLQIMVGSMSGVVNAPVLATVMTPQTVYEMCLKAVCKGTAADAGTETMQVMLAAALVKLIGQEAGK